MENEDNFIPEVIDATDDIEQVIIDFEPALNQVLVHYSNLVSAKMKLVRFQEKTQRFKDESFVQLIENLDREIRHIEMSINRAQANGEPIV